MENKIQQKRISSFHSNFATAQELASKHEARVFRIRRSAKNHAEPSHPEL